MQISDNTVYRREPNLDQPFPVRWDRHLTSFRKDHFWELVKQRLNTLQLSKGVETHYADASLTLHNKNKRTCVKVTTGGEVYVERKLPNFEYRSDRFHFKTMTESVDKFVECVTQHLPVSVLA